MKKSWKEIEGSKVRIDVGSTMEQAMSDSLPAEVICFTTDNNIVFNGEVFAGDGSVNAFYASLTRIQIMFDGIQNGICELECSRYTHNLINNGSTVEVKSTTNRGTLDTGFIHLFASPAVASMDNKRVDIYYFKFIVNDVEQLSLVPVLKDGKPCFFDEISKTYLFITGNKKIYYATKDNPTNELTYNG